MRTPSRVKLAILLTVMLFSGTASIINQIIWQRALQIWVSGGEAISAMTVVVVFLLGLGGGAMLAASLTPRIGRPLLALGLVELVLAMINLGVIGLLGHDWTSFAPVLYRLALGTGVALPLVYALFSALVLTIPCLLMGTTVPLASEGAQRQLGVTESRFITIVIVLNTLGAAAGGLFGGFVLLPVFGQRIGLLAAVGCNVVASLMAFLICRSQGFAAKVPDCAEESRDHALTIAPRYEDWVGMALGFFALSFEMYLLRLSVQKFAALPYTFATVLCAYLACWSVGVLISRRLRVPLFQTLIASAMGVWAIMMGLSGQSLLEFAIRGSLPCVLFGMAFGELASRVSDSWGNDVGRFYGWNTIGSCLGVVGTVLLGYEFHPDWTALMMIAGYAVLTAIEIAVARPAFLRNWSIPIGIAVLLIGCWAFSGHTYFLVALILFACVLILSIIGDAEQTYSATQIVVAVAVVLLSQLYLGDLATILVGISLLLWQQRQLFPLRRAPPPMVHRICWGLLGVMLVLIVAWTVPLLNRLRPQRGKYFGRQGIVEVRRDGLYWDGLWHSEFSDGQNHVGTKNWLMAVNPLVAHSSPTELETLVIGLASGITARTLAISSCVRSVDAYEINAKLSRLYEDYPDGCLNVATNPKIRIFYEDGRAGLAIREKKYDLITQAPLYLKQAGSSILLSREYMQLVRRRLKDDGIYCIYCNGTDAQARVVRRTAEAVFPHTESCGQGYMILASGQPIDFSASRVRGFLERSSGVILTELSAYGIPALASQLDRPRLESGGSTILVTDDHPVVEYPDILERLTR